MLMDTTSNSSPPSLACKASSAGISLRQGTHQVAQRFTSTVRPRQSASDLGVPLPSLKASSGRLFGALAIETAATSPDTSGVIRRAVSTEALQAGSGPALPVGRPTPYPPASPAATPTTPNARIRAIRLLA